MTFSYNVEDFKAVRKRYGIYQVTFCGWVAADHFEIIARFGSKEVFRTKGSVRRDDVCKALNYPVKENQYGFIGSFETAAEGPTLTLVCRIDNTELVLGNRQFYGWRKTVSDFHVRYNYWKNSKAEYQKKYNSHVPSQVRERDRINLVHINEMEMAYDPADPHQYNLWLKSQTYHRSSHEFKNVTFIIVGRKNVKIPSAYQSVQMDQLDLSRISTEYVCFVKDTCRLYPMFFNYLEIAEKYDLLYCDSDHVDKRGRRSHPDLKPGFSYDTLRGVNYIGNVFMVRRDLLKKFDGTKINLYGYLLYLTDMTNKIGHISRVLYGDTAKETNKIGIVERYFRDRGIEASVVPYRQTEADIVRYKVQGTPLVSIVIPTKDHKDDLQKCIDSIRQKSTYSHYEIIIVDNNSEEKESLDYFKGLEETYPEVHVHRMEVPFNYSLLNNEAVRSMAKGEYIVLLNNDIEVITHSWLEDMLGYCQMDGVGAVGVKLLYPDRTIQHAGVIIGKGGVAGHVYTHKPADFSGYGYELKTAYNVSCCTAACLMVKKSVYLAAGGLDENIRVAFNDVDFNLRLLAMGLRNVFLPFVEMYHYESKSRGTENTPEKVARFNSEVELVTKKWPEALKHDHYYNKNYSLDADYMLRYRNSINMGESDVKDEKI